MFRVVFPPIIRSAYNCIYSIWYLSHRYCYLPLSRKSWNWFECAVGGVRHPQHTQYTQIPDVVDTVVCAPDDGWKYHPKHVEQFPDMNKLCNVASCWIYIGILLRSSQRHAVAQLVEALLYKPEGRGFDSRWCHWIFTLT